MAREKQTLQEQLLKDITALLNKEKIPYIITGSLTTKLLKELGEIDLEPHY